MSTATDKITKTIQDWELRKREGEAYTKVHISKLRTLRKKIQRAEDKLEDAIEEANNYVYKIDHEY